MPQLCIDPVLLAANVVVRLQGIVAREVDPQEAAVLTVGSMQAGQTENVIADHAVLKLDIRSQHHQTRDRVIKAMKRIIEKVSATFTLLSCPGTSYKLRLCSLSPMLCIQITLHSLLEHRYADGNVGMRSQWLSEASNFRTDPEVPPNNQRQRRHANHTPGICRRLPRGSRHRPSHIECFRRLYGLGDGCKQTSLLLVHRRHRR